MESPFNRPIAVEVIGKALDDFYNSALINPVQCGYSIEMQIYTLLKQAGYLTESAMVPNND